MLTEPDLFPWWRVGGYLVALGLLLAAIFAVRAMWPSSGEEYKPRHRVRRLRRQPRPIPLPPEIEDDYVQVFSPLPSVCPRPWYAGHRFKHQQRLDDQEQLEEVA